MRTSARGMIRLHRGVGLIEVMISIIIAMLLVLVIYQVYEISESQKRTITGGSDAQQNASYGLYVLGRDLAMAGNGVASSASQLIQCPFDAADVGQSVFPVPVVINTAASDNESDTITVFYGGSSTLSTPAKFLNSASTAVPYLVPGPVGFSDNDVIAAVEGPLCTLSTINAGGVAVNASGFATVTHTPVAGNIGAVYTASASLINLGKSKCPNPPANPAQQATVGRIQYTVDEATHALRTQNLLGIDCGIVVIPANLPVSPIISDVVNLKAQYGIDSNGDGIVDAGEWQDGAWLANLLALPLPPALPTNRLTALRQLVAVRIAIVTRSTQCEREKVTIGPLKMFENPDNPNDPNTVKMQIEDSDQPCTPRYYRYRVLETIVPLRNALWNGS